MRHLQADGMMFMKPKLCLPDGFMVSHAANRRKKLMRGNLHMTEMFDAFRGVFG